MKKLSIIMLFAVISTTVTSQSVVPFIQTGIGYHSTAKTASVELLGGATFREKLVLSAGFQTPMSHVKSAGAQFQGRLGYQINASESLWITPYVGISNFYRPSDDKSLNYTRPLYAVDISHNLRDERGSIYAGASSSGKSFIYSIGIRYSFLND